MAARKKAAPGKATGKAAEKPAARPRPAPTPETQAQKQAEVQAKPPCLSLAQKRAIAKNAMWVSLAVLTATAFTGAHKRGASRSLHIASGAALIGLTLWHHTLYNRKKAEQCPEPAL